MKHVPGKKHTAADGLSRRPRGPSDDIDEVHEKDIDDFIDEQLNCVRVCPVSVNEAEEELPLEGSYSEESQRIARYLTTLTWPNEMNRKAFRKFKSWALQFLVRDRQLFKRANKNVPLRRVVDETEDQQKILKQLHDEDEHKGREGTYRRVADRYWWRNLYKDCERYVASCDVCQRRKPNRKKEALHPTWVSAPFKKIGIDCVHMPASGAMKAMMVARNDLTEWVKARALPNLKAGTIAKFI